jgi:hypothetical protein
MLQDRLERVVHPYHRTVLERERGRVELCFLHQRAGHTIESKPGDIIDRYLDHNPEESQSPPVGQKGVRCSELLRKIKRGIGQDLVEHMIISSGESDVFIACGLGPTTLE